MGFAEWAGKNLTLGALVRHTASATGKVGKYTLKGVGLAAEAVGGDVGNSIRKGCDVAGDGLDKGLSVTGAAVGKGVDATMQAVGTAGGGAAAWVVEQRGGTEKDVAMARKVGTVVTTAGVGMLAGGFAAESLVAAAAAPGTAGAAATTSGLAGLGGGSVAAGGGGMAAGQAVVNGVVAAGTASGVASASDSDD